MISGHIKNTVIIGWGKISKRGKNYPYYDFLPLVQKHDLDYVKYQNGVTELSHKYPYSHISIFI